MKKCLIVSTLSSQFTLFEKGNIKALKELGYEISCAANCKDNPKGLNKLDVNVINFDIVRSPFSLKNIKAYKQLKQIILAGDYNIVHCHSPIGGVLTRLATRNLKKPPLKVIYTAHGFHFFKGGPLLYWLFFYPIEKWLSKYTDLLITINSEDYNLAQKFYAKNVALVNGIGVDTERFNKNISHLEKEKLYKEFGLKNTDFIMVCVGELNSNKNQIMQIKALRKLVAKDSNIKLVLAGVGKNKEKIKAKIKKYNLENNVKLIGYCYNIEGLLKIANVLLSTSKREGLPVNVMEALASGVPVIGTNCRGTKELVKEGINGYLIQVNNYEELISRVVDIKNGAKMSPVLLEKYSIQYVKDEMKKLYEMYN